MSFVKKTAGTKTNGIKDKSKPTLCAPIRVSDINYNNINTQVSDLDFKPFEHTL